jgi:hypothetical protein
MNHSKKKRGTDRIRAFRVESIDHDVKIPKETDPASSGTWMKDLRALLIPFAANREAIYRMAKEKLAEERRNHPAIPIILQPIPSVEPISSIQSVPTIQPSQYNDELSQDNDELNDYWDD